MRIIEDLFNIVAPHQCLMCAQEGSLLCYPCGKTLPSVPPRCYRCGRWNADFRTCEACRKHSSIHSLWAVTKYEGPAKELVHRIKFERARAGATSIAGMLADRYSAEEDLVITYVPTANTRTRQRGYDQAALIARELSRQLNQPCFPLLARQGQQRQVGNIRDKRLTQMRDAFRAIKPHVLHAKHVLLVDDVLTTGATCEAAAQALRQAGAKRVSAAVFAVA